MLVAARIVQDVGAGEAYPANLVDDDPDLSNVASRCREERVCSGDYRRRQSVGTVGWSTCWAGSGFFH